MMPLARFREAAAHRDEAFVREWSDRLVPRHLLLVVVLAAVFGVCIHLDHPLSFTLPLVVSSFTFVYICARFRRVWIERVLREGVLVEGTRRDGDAPLLLGITLRQQQVVTMLDGRETIFDIGGSLPARRSKPALVLYRPGKRNALAFWEAGDVVVRGCWRRK